MHSHHHSRARVLFEVLCAWGVAASFVGAWNQTYANALLPAAAIAGLYGLVHLFDLRRPRPLAEPKAVVDALRGEPVVADAPAEVTPVAAPIIFPEAEPVADADPAASDGKARRKTAKRASSGGKSRRAARAEEPVIVEAPAEPEAGVVAAFAVPEFLAQDLEAELRLVAERESEPTPVAEVAADADAEPDHDYAAAPIAPLFETDPYARTRRTAFGRKAG